MNNQRNKHGERYGYWDQYGYKRFYKDGTRIGYAETCYSNGEVNKKQYYII